VEEAVVATRHAGRLLQGHADHRVQGPWGGQCYDDNSCSDSDEQMSATLMI
jgi:hypothetical protein